MLFKRKQLLLLPIMPIIFIMSSTMTSDVSYIRRFIVLQKFFNDGVILLIVFD